MGYDTLNAALAFPNNLPPKKAHIVITDTLKSDANFIIHHFTSNHLKTEQRVILVGLSQIFNHYFLISRKLGTNLTNFKQSGQYIFIDGLTHLNPYSVNTPFPTANTPTTPSDTLNGSIPPSSSSHELEEENVLKTFYQQIKKYIQSGCIVILDDISTLLSNGFGSNNIYIFIKKLKALIESADSTLVTLIHVDEEGSDDVEQDTFIKSIVQTSELVLQFQPLGSGLAKDVHGQLSIIYGPKYIPGTTLTQPQSMHYKILDNNAQFFAKGISQGVL
ncbi:hypothetical protein BJ944DRAFT_286592 [Cunninghamella echinulata]|nr:hypothetical protein BJ944DRAFT_286592 [Cunninghamella echinulata]